MQRPARRAEDFAEVDARWIVVPLAFVAAVLVAVAAMAALPTTPADAGVAAEAPVWHAA